MLSSSQGCQTIASAHDGGTTYTPLSSGRANSSSVSMASAGSPSTTISRITDISKTHLDVYVVPAGQAARFPNDAAGFKALIAWVEVPVRAVTYEPTGRWHRAFEEALLEAGLCRWCVSTRGASAINCCYPALISF